MHVFAYAPLLAGAAQQQSTPAANDYAITCQAGAYTYTGSSTTISRNRALTANAGSYTYTGSSTTLVKGRALTLNAGSYTYTGSSTTISRNRGLTANSGSYVYTGSSATVSRNRSLTANSGSYTYTGSSVTIDYTQPAVDYPITCLSGSYTLSGQSVEIYRSKSLIASAGAYSYAGEQVVIERNRSLTAQAGAYAYTGQDIAITYTVPGAYTVECLAGEYVVTGSSIVIDVSSNVESPPVGAGGSSSRNKKRPSLVIVEIDGKEYRVPVEQLQEFLDAIPQKADPQPIPKKRKSKQKVVQAVAPQVIIKAVPQADIELVQKHVDRTNEIMRQVWEGALQRYLDELEDEEALLWLIV